MQSWITPKAPVWAPVDRTHPLVRGCVFWARLAEGGGVPIDCIGRIRGTQTGTPAWKHGVTGPHVDFSGTGNYFQFGNPQDLRLTEAITVSCWFYDDGVGSPDGAICGKVSGNWKYMMQVNASAQQILFKLNTLSTCVWPISSALGGLDFLHGTWVHVVGTYDRNFIRIYGNGELQNSVAYTTAIINDSDPFAIGARGNGSSEFNAPVSDVRIYNRALTPAEIRALYKNPEAGLRYTHRDPWRALGVLAASAAGGGGPTTNPTHLALPLLGVG